METTGRQNESRVDWEDATRMFLQGRTFEEIGKKYGVSRQAVHSHFYRIIRQGRPRQSRVKYIGIAEWLYSEQYTYTDMARMVYGEENVDRKKVAILSRVLTGKSIHAEIWLIKKILEVTGMTFEEAFRTEDEQCS